MCNSMKQIKHIMVQCNSNNENKTKQMLKHATAKENSKYNFDERSQTQYTWRMIIFKWTS